MYAVRMCNTQADLEITQFVYMISIQHFVCYTTSNVVCTNLMVNVYIFGEKA
jgi:hypothetical protein